MPSGVIIASQFFKEYRKFLVKLREESRVLLKEGKQIGELKILKKKFNEELQIFFSKFLRKYRLGQKRLELLFVAMEKRGEKRLKEKDVFAQFVSRE